MSDSLGVSDDAGDPVVPATCGVLERGYAVTVRDLRIRAGV